MITFKLFYSLEKETNWLEEMAQRGYILQRKGMFYHFKETKSSNDISIEIDVRYFTSRNEYETYITECHKSGWTHLSGSYYSGVHYFMGEDRQNQNSFPQKSSTGLKYLRLAETYITFWIVLFVLSMLLMVNGTIDAGMLLEPKSMFVTPDIWSLEGWSLWKAILFEIPFILIRILYTYALVIWSFVLGFIGLKYYRWYKASDSEKVKQ